MSENEKIKVLQIVEGLSRGGAEGKLIEMIERMDNRRFETILVSLGLGEAIHDLGPESRIELVTMPRGRRLDIRLIRDLVRLVKEKQIDIVMTTLFYADVMGAIAGRLAGVKAMFSWETISAPEWLIKRRLWPYRFAMRYCDRIISVSRATADWLVEKRGVPEEKVMVIPYGVDEDRFGRQDGDRIRKDLGLSPKDFVIGTAARLHPQKGHRFLLRAVKRLAEDDPRVRWLIAGDGVCREELESAVRDEGLEKHVRFLGYCGDIPGMLSAFDVFVLPSLYEGLPNCVLEAMAAGKPVVASAVDGTVEAVVDGETGVLVPPGDANRLYAVLSDLMGKPDLLKTMGAGGRRRVEQTFSLKKQVEAFQDLYEAYYRNAGR